MTTYMGALRIELNKLLENNTYERVAEMYSTDKRTINKGIVWKMANIEDYEPKDEEIRLAFGLRERITINISRDEKGRFS